MNVATHMALVPGTTGRESEQAAWSVQATGERRQASNLIADATTTRDRATLMQVTRDARTALEEAVAATTAAAQRVRSVTAALEDALDLLAATDPASPPQPARRRDPAPPVAALSPREREVLALVAEGRSNKAIANALFVSPNTVKTHVASLLNKLHADTRAQLAAFAARHGTI